MAHARARKDDNVTWMVLLFFGGMAVISWFNEQPWWLRTLVVVAAVLAASGWWLLLRMPTTCGVANRSNVGGCSNNVRGLLRACWLADHKGRKQKLLWARVLRRPTQLPPASGPSRPLSSRGATTVIVNAPGAGGYHLESAGYRATILVCTLLSTVGGMVSALVTVIQMFGAGSPSS